MATEQQYPKTWSNQPDRCLRARPVCLTSVRKTSFEVRKTVTGLYLVTVGNLFSSETVECPDADTVFGLMQAIDPEKTMKLPIGVTKVDNHHPS